MQKEWDMTENKNDPCQELTSTRRVNYYTGMLLSEADLRQEQSYQREKSRQHLRYLHGYGTVCGLQVVPYGSEKPAFIKVEPGLALDRWGREIIVPQAAELDLEAYAHDAGGALFVVLEYKETPVDQHPTPGAVPEAETSSPARVLETFELLVRDKPPETSRHSNTGFNEILKKARSGKLDAERLHQLLCEYVIQPCEPCASDPGVALAKVTFPPKGPVTRVDIDNCTYRPIALPTNLLMEILVETLRDQPEL
jgi:hypothetical protein